MALGFQRIHDLSPLSLKLLNDQLEQLWKKMMGGLETRDMTSAVAAKINAAVTEGNFTSLIEQNADAIRLTAGSAAGENLIANGNAAFGTEGWNAQGADIAAEKDDWKGHAFLLCAAGSISQGPIKLRAGAKYALCFSFQCPQGASAAVEADIAQGAPQASEEWADYKLRFTAEAAADATVALTFSGPAKVSEIMLCEGDGGAWRQNPNEIKNSSIELTDERVAIDTRNFALRLYNALGQMVTEMTADEQGFSTLSVAENIRLRGKPFYMGEGDHHLWVHPNAAQAGERAIFTAATEPTSLEGCFCDIQEAIDAIPRWCDGNATVHIYGGGAWQYPSGKIVLSHFYGGGKVALAPWASEHYTLKRVEVTNNSLVVDIMGADINSCGAGDCFHVENSVCTLYECRVNGRYRLDGAGSAGYDATYGALMLLSNCEAHQCHTAAHAHMGGRIVMEFSAGSGNFTGCMATAGGMMQQSYSTFAADTPHFESTGGVISPKATLQKPGTPPAETPMEYAAVFPAILTRSVDTAAGWWISSSDWLRVGGGVKAAMWFDTEALRAKIGVRTIVHASLTLRRRGMGGKAAGVEVELSDLMSANPSGGFYVGASRGTLGAWAWGEKKTAAVALGAINALVRGQSNGFALAAGGEAVFEGVSERAPTLEIVYR